MEYTEEDVQPEEMVIRGKQPWLGAFLNFFGFSGIGYFYSQDFLKGIVVLLLATAIYCTCFSLIFFEPIPLVPLILCTGALLLALSLYVTIDVFRTIKKRNSSNFEHFRKQHKDPWRAVFWTFLWPGLGHAYLRRWISFILISLLNLFAFVAIEKISNPLLNNVIFYAGFQVTYCGIFALHCYWLCIRNSSQGYKIRYALYAIGYRGLCKCLSILFLLVFVMNVGQLYRTPGESMAPTILPGDSVFVSKVAYWHDSPVPGDMIVFQKEAWPVSYIKRVVAVGGQTVEVNDNGILFVDGEEFYCENLTYHIDKKALKFLRNREFLIDGKYQVPDDCYYVIGDNYSYSYDSRNFGPLKKDEIIGKAIRIIPKTAFWWNTD